jgi:hypothetical protein
LMFGLSMQDYPAWTARHGVTTLRYL